VRPMEQSLTQNWLDEVRWDENGLVPVITQDARSGRVLTLAWLNREALELACEEGRAIYWSRSRSRLWRKGEESGHVQKLQGIYLDCDADAVIYAVEQVGGIACHTGRESCFYRRLVDGNWEIADAVIRDPQLIYANHGRGAGHE
jgi:phosphoribosyl-AMP cyclohydrolase